MSLATQSCSLFSPIPLLHPFSACVGSACQQSLETCSNLDPLPNKGLQTWDDFHLPWFFSIDLGKGAEAGFTGNSAPLLESLCWQLNPRILSLKCNRSWTAFILGGKTANYIKCITTTSLVDSDQFHSEGSIPTHNTDNSVPNTPSCGGIMFLNKKHPHCYFL